MSVPLEMYRNIDKYQASFVDLVNVLLPLLLLFHHIVRLCVEHGCPKVRCPREVAVSCFLLQGSPQQVLLARCALVNLATDCETTTDVMEVPQTAFRHIIGRGGESLKLITRTTGARIICPREIGRGLEEKGKVSITGMRMEVRQAKKVFKYDTVRRRITQSSALRQKRRPFEPQGQSPEELKPEEAPQSFSVKEEGLVQANGTSAQAAGEEVQLAREAREEEMEEDEIVSPDSLSEVFKFEIPSPDLRFQPDGHLQVYVSASENPHHFWIQILGLDKLSAEMSRFYSNGTLQVRAASGDHYGGGHCGCSLPGLWQLEQARVLGVMGSGLVDLDYVDFADNIELPRDSLRSMRNYFLSLPFQAIECSLAGVNPAGEVWSEEALDDFDCLTVQLYDNTEGKTVDLGEELVSLGHAVPNQDNEVETTGGNSTWSLNRDNNLEDEESSSKGAISIGSTLSTSLTHEYRWLGEGEGRHGVGEDSTENPSVVV
ncbi:unnamed protein product, partial [Coregonus sp. 'balchen']